MNLHMDFEQQLLGESVARFVANEYGFDHRTKVAAAGTGEPLHWQTFAENGWLASAMPASFGGLEGSPVETAIISQQLGRGLVLEPWLGGAVLAAQTLLAAGDDALLAEWVPPLCGGSRRLALAYSERGARGLPQVVATQAQPHDGGWRISGCKTLVLGAIGADAFIVSARTNGGVDDRAGIGLFLIPADASGLSVAPVRLHDASIAGEVTLDGVEAQALGDPANGIEALGRGIEHGTLALCAELIGGMEQVIEITAEYLRTRQQFGVTIGSFQALQHRIADMAAEMELARSMLFAALASFQNDDAATRALVLSQTKFLVTGAARNVCGQGIQLHGGIGMTEECAVGHYFKRAVVADALFGNRSLHQAGCAAIARAQILGEAA